jgi:hypothetical protein
MAREKKAPEPETLKKEANVIQLRLAGATWTEIAAAVGYSGPSGAYGAYQRAAKRVIAPKIEELREMELDRLDRLQRGVWASAIGGNVRAVDSVLRIMDRRARLLGLDMPVRLDINAREEIIHEVERLAAELEVADPNIVDAEVIGDGDSSD